MKINKIIKIESDLKARVNGIFRDAIRDKIKHESILNKLSYWIWESLLYKELPRYTQNLITGYIDAQFACLDRDHLRFGYRMPDGGIHYVNDEYIRYTPQQVCDYHLYSASFWKETEERFTYYENEHRQDTNLPSKQSS